MLATLDCYLTAVVDGFHCLRVAVGLTDRRLLLLREWVEDDL